MSIFENEEIIEEIINELKEEPIEPEIKIKKKYNYGDKYKGRYETKQYYNVEYHKARYIEKNEEYKRNAELRKTRVKNAILLLKSQGIKLNSL